MNAQTPPSRKVAKPKSKTLPRAARAVSAPEAPAPVTETPATEPPATPADKPTFVETEAPEQRKGGKRHHHKWNKPHAKAAPANAAPAETAPEAEKDEMGPQTRHLTLLGNKTIYSDRYTPAILEAFDNRHKPNPARVHYARLFQYGQQFGGKRKRFFACVDYFRKKFFKRLFLACDFACVFAHHTDNG